MASARNLWQEVAPAGLFPLFHTCFSCGVVMGYTLMPFTKASSKSLLLLLRHWSLDSAGILLCHWGHTFGPSLWSTSIPHSKTPGALCSPAPWACPGTWSSGGRCAPWPPAHCGGQWQSLACLFYQGMWVLHLPFDQGMCPLLLIPCCCCCSRLSPQVSFWQQLFFLAFSSSLTTSSLLGPNSSLGVWPLPFWLSLLSVVQAFLRRGHVLWSGHALPGGDLHFLDSFGWIGPHPLSKGCFLFFPVLLLHLWLFFFCLLCFSFLFLFIFLLFLFVLFFFQFFFFLLLLFFF